MLNRPLDSDIRGRSTLTVHWIVMTLLPAVSSIGRSLLWIHQAKPTAIFVHLGYGHCSTNSVGNLTSAQDSNVISRRVSRPSPSLSALTSVCPYLQQEQIERVQWYRWTFMRWEGSEYLFDIELGKLLFTIDSTIDLKIKASLGDRCDWFLFRFRQYIEFWDFVRWKQTH